MKLITDRYEILNIRRKLEEINQESPEIAAGKYSDWIMEHQDIITKSNKNLFQFALENNLENTIKTLLLCGVRKIIFAGKSPIQNSIAYYSPSPEFIRLLLESGEDVNIISNKSKESLLHLLLKNAKINQSNKREIVKILINKGINLNTNDEIFDKETDYYRDIKNLFYNINSKVFSSETPEIRAFIIYLQKLLFKEYEFSDAEKQDLSLAEEIITNNSNAEVRIYDNLESRLNKIYVAIKSKICSKLLESLNKFEEKLKIIQKKITNETNPPSAEELIKLKSLESIIKKKIIPIKVLLLKTLENIKDSSLESQNISDDDDPASSTIEQPTITREIITAYKNKDGKIDLNGKAGEDNTWEEIEAYIDQNGEIREITSEDTSSTSSTLGKRSLPKTAEEAPAKQAKHSYTIQNDKIVEARLSLGNTDSNFFNIPHDISDIARREAVEWWREAHPQEPSTQASYNNYLESSDSDDDSQEYSTQLSFAAGSLPSGNQAPQDLMLLIKGATSAFLESHH